MIRIITVVKLTEAFTEEGVLITIAVCVCVCVCVCEQTNILALLLSANFPNFCCLLFCFYIKRLRIGSEVLTNDVHQRKTGI